MTTIAERLEALLGTDIKDMCANGYGDPTLNHCAHFVSHAIGGFCLLSSCIRSYAMNRFFAIFACCASLGVAAVASAQTYTPPADSRSLLNAVDFKQARELDEGYRAEFARCDSNNIFRGHLMEGWRRCNAGKNKSDKNNVRALLTLPDGSIFYESKLGLDLDGSWKAWNNKGKTDLRATWYQWPRVCNESERDSKGLCQREQVDAEHIPYIVIPTAGPNALGKEFQNKTGIGKGDFGVVIYGERWAPAFVGDGGPFNKLGEASAAVFTTLGQDRCTHHNAQEFCDSYRDKSVPQGVITIIFPGSRLDGMTPENAVSWACDAAMARLKLTGSPLCER